MGHSKIKFSWQKIRNYYTCWKKINDAVIAKERVDQEFWRYPDAKAPAANVKQ